MLGRVMDLQFVGQALGLGWIEGLIEAGRAMDIELVHNQRHFVGNCSRCEVGTLRLVGTWGRAFGYFWLNRAATAASAASTANASGSKSPLIHSEAAS